MLVAISENSLKNRPDPWKWTDLYGFYFYGKMDDHFGPGKIYVSKQDWYEIESKFKKDSYYREYGFETPCFVEGYAPMGETYIYMWESEPTGSRCGLIIDSHDEKAYKFARTMMAVKADLFIFLDPSTSYDYIGFAAKLIREAKLKRETQNKEPNATGKSEVSGDLQNAKKTTKKTAKKSK